MAGIKIEQPRLSLIQFHAACCIFALFKFIFILGRLLLSFFLFILIIRARVFTCFNQAVTSYLNKFSFIIGQHLRVRTVR